ncbi:MAG: hypothetical protein RBT05_07745 [Bacteroidales bacterium]|jgi:hypothetical protein|nr:hypothetical protein [Bacteroidales bacterium]
MTETKEKTIEEIEAFSRVLASEVSKRGISRRLISHNKLQLLARYYIEDVDRCTAAHALDVSIPLVDKIYSRYAGTIDGEVHNLRRKYFSEIYENRIAVAYQAGEMRARRSL